MHKQTVFVSIDHGHKYEGISYLDSRNARHE